MFNPISKIEILFREKANTVFAMLFALVVAGCTNESVISFKRQDQVTNAQMEVNTKIDILWVIDNSSSMDSFQNTLRSGVAEFTRTYMNPNWDIRAAAITTDTYIANTVFTAYLETAAVAAGAPVSSHIRTLIDAGKWRAPAAWGAQQIIDPVNKIYSQALKFKHIVPAWGPSFAKLLPGNHDGPISGFCFDSMNYFINGSTKCKIRDDAANGIGTAKCLNPGLNESGLSQCVNTVLNDTVHSGKPIISTMPPAGTPGNQAWIDQLVKDFTINVTTSSVGHGSERGLGSVLQFLDDNETANSKFFRADSIRTIIFVSDEEDQTLDYPAATNGAAGNNFNPFTDYGCDLNGLNAMNPDKLRSVSNTCCKGDGCNKPMYGSWDTTCPSKTVDGYTYTPSVCANVEKLKPVSAVKSRLDSFFNKLDGKEPGSLNKTYFVGSLVALTGDSIQRLQGLRDREDAEIGGLIKMVSTDRADRYIELGNLVGNNSIAYDIGAASYTPLLNSIARSAIYQRGLIKTTFTINPDKAWNIIKILHADGSETVVQDNQYEILDHAIQITDIDLLMSFVASDKLAINYSPYKRY